MAVRDEAHESSDGLAGKVALVTGGARGIGRGIAERLASAGVLVAVNYASNSAAADDTVNSIRTAGGEAFTVRARLGTDGSIETLIHALDTELGRRNLAGIDVLVNNIGGSAGHGTDSIPEMEEDALRYVFNNNVFAPILLTQALLTRLNDDGRVVNISSAASRLALQQPAAYSMAKAALEMFTRILAKELGPRGITVNSVGPGYTNTEVNSALFSDPARSREIAELTLLRRLGQVSDISDFVYALASRHSRWITGQTIEASGGFRF